jgi:hypothetical protein
MVGRDHRDDLEEQAAGVDGQEGDSSESSGGPASEKPTGSSTSGVPTSAGVAVAGAPAGLGLVSEVDTRYLIAGGIVLLAVVYLLTADGSSEGDQSEEPVGEQGDQAEIREGLVG